ncbi:MAG: chromosomal replication initiator protein DnaA [Oscillospiraceae bacterium]|nr:chromosomal replication initiator protein DnaA [Oscillospiraceae bacterium]
MESFMQVFNLVKNACHEGISDVAFNLWISPLEPVKLENDTAYLFIKSEFQKNIILDKYFKLLSKSFNQVLGFDVKIEILTESADQQKKGEKNLVELDSKTVSDSMPNGDYEYTFDTFIVGSSNNFAVAASRAVASRQSGSYNPLFIYGPSGLGKTHLLMAIRHEIQKNNPDINIIYVNGESFTNEFITAIENETTNQFHTKYRNAEILLVDDIQFVAGKERTQEEFFHTFNELHRNGRQIVLASDRPPKDIKTLEERLRTRFESGLITDITTPDFETRIAIIRRKAELLDIDIPEEVAEFIANRLKNNIRQLEGAVKKIKAYKLLAGSSPSIAVAQHVIKDILTDTQPIPVTIQRIIEEVGRTYGIAPEDIEGPMRTTPISNARKIAIYVVREITQIPLQEIGVHFNNRDHSTVVYAIKDVEKTMKKDPHYKGVVEDIIKNIRDN